MGTVHRIPRLMLVTDRRRAILPLPELARQALAGGVDVVQIREKDLTEDELRRLTISVVAAAGDPTRLSVNGNIAVARCLETGVHLPEDGITPAAARAMLGPTALIGRSVHRAAAARTTDGADYLIAGHIFATASKPDLPPIGLDGLRRIVQAASCPVLAIGGVSGENVRSVIAAGAHGVAVISAINSAAEPGFAACAIRQQMQLDEEVAMEATATSVEVTINGKRVDLEPGTTVQQFLHAKGYQDRLVVVELNESILPRTAYLSTVLTAGDHVEIVHFVGGG
jgi:thiamine biosynthesis protein ThiS